MRRIFYTKSINTAFAFFGELRLMIRRCDGGGGVVSFKNLSRRV